MSYQHNNPIVLKVQAAADKDLELGRTGRVTGLLGLAHSEIQDVSGRLKEVSEYGALPEEVLTTLNALVQQIGVCRGIYLSRLNDRKREESAQETAQVEATKGNRPARDPLAPRRRMIELDDKPTIQPAPVQNKLNHSKRFRRIEMD